MDSWLKDIRFGFKMLLKDRGFAATGLLTLGLCIGANLAVFSIVNSVLLRPLPIPEAERILVVNNSYPKAGAEVASNGVPDYFDRRQHVTAFEEQAIYRTTSHSLGEGSVPERVAALTATPSLFSLLQVQPALGRLFTEQEGEIGHEDKVLLSHQLWQRSFGADPGVIGKNIKLSGRPFEVIGVMKREFLFLDPEVELWVPAAFTEEQRSDDARHSNSWQMIGRLADGATINQARSQILAVNAANMERFPDFRETLTNAGFTTLVSPLQEEVVEGIRGTLYLLWAGVFFVLLIGIVNLANLTLVRSTARAKELSLRQALGASRSRVARQLLTESFLLAGAGGLLGIGLGHLGLKGLQLLGMNHFPRSSEITIGLVPILVALGLTALTALALGLLPLSQLPKRDSHETLSEEGRSGTANRKTRGLRRALVVTQVAFAFVLLVGAGLLLTSFRKVLAIEPGFEPEGVLTATLDLPPSRYEDEAALRAFVDRSLERIGNLPGVDKVGVIDALPFGSRFNNSVIFAEGYEMAPGESIVSPSRCAVSDSYFATLGIPLVAGRFFDHRDTADAKRVVIVDQRLARRFWPGEDPIGRRMFFPSEASDLLKLPPEEEMLTVVGVVGEIKMHRLVDSREPVGAYYFPFPQSTGRTLSIALRGPAPETLRAPLTRTMAALDPELPLFEVRTMKDRMQQTLITRRTPTILALTFAAVALLLATIGVYGTLAYLVTQRRREFGIRLALGSGKERIRRLVLREGTGLMAVGLALGLVASIALGRFLKSQLYDIEPTHAGVLASVAVVLMLVSVFASLVPALKATRIDPMVALSSD
ncbi:MAG: ABC transporter permease [Deltaproteobacteria bacterium]|nr:ABC transporter permease [Deltaproteobacteria bacterium]